jgi:hypothetical protein
MCFFRWHSIVCEPTVRIFSISIGRLVHVLHLSIIMFIVRLSRQWSLPVPRATYCSTDIDSILQLFAKNVLLTHCHRLIDRLTMDLLERLKYLTHMKFIRDCFLFENGSLMHQFSLRLYAKLSQTIHERLDAFTVLVSFDSTLNMFGLNKSQYPFSVIYQASNESNSMQLKYIIQHVQLKYDLPRELSRLIQIEHFDIYQKCFAFVLQVKQAKYVLDQLLFIGRITFRFRSTNGNRVFVFFDCLRRISC